VAVAGDPAVTPSERADLLFLDGTVHPNKTALQFYVSADVATEPAFPFGPRDEYRGMTVPGTDALLVWPTDDPPSFPLTIEECPRELVPWPLDDQHAAPSTD
jgi:hypothetical protein